MVQPVRKGRQRWTSQGTSRSTAARCQLLNEPEPSAGRGAFGIAGYDVLLSCQQETKRKKDVVVE